MDRRGFMGVLGAALPLLGLQHEKPTSEPGIRKNGKTAMQVEVQCAYLVGSAERGFFTVNEIRVLEGMPRYGDRLE